MRVFERTTPRFRAHALAVFVGWPLFTILATVMEAGGLPYYHLPLHHALAASVVGVALLAPDFALTGLAYLAASVFLFERLSRSFLPRRPRAGRLYSEPAAMFVFIVCGTAVWYPTVLSQAVFVPFWTIPSALVLSLLVFLGIMLVFEVAPRGKRLRTIAVLSAVGVAVPVPSLVAGAVKGGGAVTDVMVLGLDSLAQSDDVADLRRWTQSRQGQWYEHAVAPGLVTNAVWASVLTMAPVHEHHVFHAFQRLPGGRAPLLELAKNAGFRTISVFPDQMTCSVGSDAGFDVDRSGPVGWRQLALATVENSSVLLALVRPLLPRLPWSVAPPNFGGTFTYDLRREIAEGLTSGSSEAPTLVASHLTYLHIGAYPRSIDLSWPERLSVAVTAAGSIRDRSFDWEDADLPTDALPLHRWKVAHLQRVVTDTLADTRFVERGGKIVVFSDHGERAGLSPKTFTEPRFHHVILASVGFPAKPTDTPISLIDIGSMIGIAPPAAADPVVEFAIGPQELWVELGRTSRPHWSGAVDLDPTLLGGIFKGLRRHRPWPGQPLLPLARHPHDAE